jgi:nucleotide-binding universal stress UspA family protein
VFNHFVVIYQGVLLTMKKLFNNILVPAFRLQTADPAVERAIHIANQLECHLHVIYVEKNGWPGEEIQGTNHPGFDNQFQLDDDKMTILHSQYSMRLQPGLQLHLSVKKGIKEKIITEYAIQHSIDLVILGRTKQWWFFDTALDVNKLARNIDCPVLTVKDTPHLEKLKNIVLPVNSHLPVRKIIMASYFANAFNAKIHLIALSKHMKTNEGHDPYLYKSYQLLNDNTKLSVECHAIAGENLADTTLEYAERIKADLIVVNPGKELRLRGFTHFLFPRFIFNKCPIPVMTISPHQP